VVTDITVEAFMASVKRGKKRKVQRRKKQAATVSFTRVIPLISFNIVLFCYFSKYAKSEIYIL